MAEKIRRKRGAQKGNQNARKHGFYSKVLTPEEQEAYQAATRVDGLDKEIAILRVKIASIAAHHPDNDNALMLATSLLARLLRTKRWLETGNTGKPRGAFSSLRDNKRNDSCAK